MFFSPSFSDICRLPIPMPLGYVYNASGSMGSTGNCGGWTTAKNCSGLTCDVGYTVRSNSNASAFCFNNSGEFVLSGCVESMTRLPSLHFLFLPPPRRACSLFRVASASFLFRVSFQPFFRIAARRKKVPSRGTENVPPGSWCTSNIELAQPNCGSIATAERATANAGRLF